MDIKENWQTTRFTGTRPEEYRAIMTGQIKYTALDRLKQRYRRFAAVGIVMTVVVGIMAANGGFLRIFGSGNIWFILSWTLYFATAAMMDTWLHYGISKINLTTMSVSEVARIALHYRKRHLQFIAILMPWMLGITGWLLYNMIHNKMMLISLIAGFLAGLIIGLRQLLEFLKEYKNLSE